jgi:hypothetical protein
MRLPFSSRRPRFRPTLQQLEDRTLPSSGWHFGPPPGEHHHVPAGPATHFQVVVPEQVYAGSHFSVVVEAEDAANHPATGYTGTVTLSLGTADSGATLPQPFTFTGAFHVFQVTLALTGSQTITATGTTTTTATITGSGTTTVDPAPAPSSIKVIAPSTAATGVGTYVTIQVLDQSGNPFRNYTGTVTVSSSDTTATGTSSHKTAAASLPITYTFTAPNWGVQSFLLTFNETAAATGTATTVKVSGTTSDPNTTISGQTSVTVYPATTVTHFGIFAFPFAGTGNATPVWVTALNASNQIVTGYTGTVTFTSGDTTATVAATKGGTATSIASFSYPFTANDAGTHEFFVTFDATGKQSLSVTDGTNTGTTDVFVGTLPPLPDPRLPPFPTDSSDISAAGRPC